ncbi:uncharacterized protein CDV56_106574 [Aspergillus thermomutatus]|uniref:Arrestin C-terminal-like domain-containing protein n=1 Tax=Aspergillus thermomutatus TaxID=41047 RepID=A0A397GMB1_ASPTH|nr:uncharacterized protein CDV56_106574 [Aspergillus thermomutatus]RHZ50674.1 hypothetical protein CDV56_106574 [Aspergillus thermomutatus]
MEARIPSLGSSTAVEIPGARRLLELLSSHQVLYAIMTLAIKALLDGWLAVLQLPRPQDVTVAGDIKIRKQDPEGYSKVWEKLLQSRSAPGQVLMMEDAPAGIEAGKAAGRKVLAVATTHTMEQLKAAGADWVPDNYEYPFQFSLSGRMLESVEGLDDSYIRYTLKAQICGMTGKSTMEIHRHIRLYREHPSLRFPEPKVIENFWPEKVIYNVSVPSQAWAFGGVIPLTVRFIPLRKGLRLDTILSRLVEYQKTTRPVPSSRSRDVVLDEYQAPNSGELDIVHDGGDWYQVTRRLQLPQSTRHCLQSVLNGLMPVTHCLNVQIGLKNPEGHTSLIRLNIPVFIHFIQAFTAVNQNTFLNLESPASTLNTPWEFLPRYEDHVRDPKPDEVNFISELPADDEGEGESLPNYSAAPELSQVPSYSTAIRSSTSSPVPF